MGGVFNKLLGYFLGMPKLGQTLLYAFLLGLLFAQVPAFGHHDNRGHHHHHKGHDRDEESDEPVCGSAQTIRLTSTRILGGHKIYFSSDSLKNIGKNTRVLSATLYLTLLDHHGFKTEDFTISLNGLSVRHIHGRSPFIFPTKGESCDVKANFRNLRIDGAMRATEFVRKIFLQKGELVFLVPGPVKVKSAEVELVLTNADENACPEEPPTDPVAPEIEITAVSPSDNPTNQTSETFSFSADQSDITFSCTLDGGASALCTSPWTVTGLTSGAHHFEVIATNSAGLASLAATYDWSVDNTPVDVKIDSVTPSATTTNASSVSIAFSSSKASAAFQCFLDGALPSACVSPATFSSLTEGTHTVAISGTDSLGNTSTVSAQYTWTVDLTAPVATILEVEHADAETTATDPTFNFSANESATFECALDNSTFTPCLSPQSFSGLTEGAHEFSVRAMDVAGNQGAATTYAWQIDLTPPEILLGNVVPKAGVTNASSASIEFSASEAATFTCALDGAAPADCASPFIANFVTEGAHELVITAKDLAGNISLPTVLDWIVDFTPPQISFGPMTPSAASVISANSLTITIVGSESYVYQAVLDGQVLAQTSGGTIVLTGLTEGTHSFVLQAYDFAGNAALPLTHTFTVDTVRPTFTINPQYGPLTNQTVNAFTFSASEIVTYQCNLDAAGYAPCNAQFMVSSLADGTHNLTVIATDSAGLMSVANGYAWTVDSTAPIVTLQSASSDPSAMTFTFSANEAATFTCSLDGQPSTVCTSPVNYTGLTDGEHTFSVTAVDAAGNSSQPVTNSFTVAAVVATYLTNVTPAESSTNSTSISFSFTSNRAQASFLCSLDGAAMEVCTSPMSYSGLASGSHSFHVAAIGDPVGASYSWTIDRTAPTITTLGATATSTTITISWTTNEPTTGVLKWGVGATPTNTVEVDTAYKTSHTVTITELTPVTVYSYTVSGVDQAGNSYASPTRGVRTPAQ